MLPRDYNITPAIDNPDVQYLGAKYEKNPGAAHGIHIQNTACIANTSASHTYGNVMSVIEKYIIDAFPKCTFATVTAATSLRSKQLNHLPRKLRKKETPILVVVPRISFGQGDDRFLANTIFASKYNDIRSTWGQGSLITLGESREKGLSISGHYNRDVMYVDIIMTFDTYSEQVNWMSYLYNMIPINHNLELGAPLELYIPNDFCKLISELTKVPIHDTNGSVDSFCKMMNTIWGYPITYKLKGGSNTDSFFMYYDTNLDVVFQDPIAGPGVKDGQVKTGYDIAMTARVDFNTIGYFTLDAPEFKKSINIKDEPKEIVPILSDQINLRDFKLPEGWTILTWPIFKLADGEDSISIAPILNKSLTTIIDYHLSLGRPMSQFIDIQLREHGDILTKDVFRIDWKERKLYLINPNCHRTYRLIVSVCPEYVNNLIKKLYGLE